MRGSMTTSAAASFVACSGVGRRNPMGLVVAAVAGASDEDAAAGCFGDGVVSGEVLVPHAASSRDAARTIHAQRFNVFPRLFVAAVPASMKGTAHLAACPG